MRRLVIGGALGVFLLSVVLVACGGSDADSSDTSTGRHFQDMYEIDQIEKDFHKATTTEGHRSDAEPVRAQRDVHGRGRRDRGGRGRDRGILDGEVAARSTPTNNWISDHPAYKMVTTVNGDRGTLHFECHFVDPETGAVVAVTAGDADVARIDGQWLITNFVGGTTEL